MVGQDAFGNVYYQLEAATARQTRKAVGSGERGYIPAANARVEDLPVEWEAWLRGRRRHPPSLDEIAANEAAAAARAIAGNSRHSPPSSQLPLGGTGAGNWREAELGERAERSGVDEAAVPAVGASPPEATAKDFPRYKDYEEVPGTTDYKHQIPKPKGQK